jgi:hypothetical protein
VLEYCAKSESHPRSGLRVLTRRINIVLVLVLVLVLEKWGWGSGVLGYCAKFELHRRAGLGMLKGRQMGRWKYSEFGICDMSTLPPRWGGAFFGSVPGVKTPG